MVRRLNVLRHSRRQSLVGSAGFLEAAQRFDAGAGGRKVHSCSRWLGQPEIAPDRRFELPMRYPGGRAAVTSIAISGAYVLAPHDG